jgi:hypothetical protein
VGELSKDKYLALLLVAMLLAAYIFTKDQIILTLLTTAVGGFLGLVRSGSSQSVTGGAGAPAISVETKKEI